MIGIRQIFQSYKHEIKSYTAGGVIGLYIFGWIWSLLFDAFYPEHNLITPWYALGLLLHHDQNTLKVNSLLWISLFIPCAIIGLVLNSIHRQQQIKKAFGDAHWASMREIKKMGLFDCKDGLIIGEKYGRLLRAPLVSHALVFAPSRSGKGVSQVIPNALTFKDSMLIVDIKDEIFQVTSGYRAKHGQQVFRFAPADPESKTHCWNPLDLIDKNSPELIADIDLVVEILISYSADKDSMWVSEARTLVKGILLWLMNSGRPFTIGEMTKFIKGTPDFIGELKFIRDMSVDENGEITIHPIAYTNINNFVEKAEKEQSGVKSTITARLNLWDDPLIQEATSKCDFDIRYMRRKGMTIYLGIQIKHLDRLAPLMNMFIQLFINAMTKNLPAEDEPYKVLVILDEFCALGRMDKLKSGFGFLAGYNVHLMAIIQNVGQFYDIYGGRDKVDVFFQNTDYKIIYRQNTKTDQEFVSQQLGNRAMKSFSNNFKYNGVSQNHTSSTESFLSRPLLTPDEVRTFPYEKGIAIFNGHTPVKYKKVAYYQDNRFKMRLMVPITIPAFHMSMQLPR
jgi:type IV secretion system protein VirD4